MAASHIASDNSKSAFHCLLLPAKMGLTVRALPLAIYAPDLQCMYEAVKTQIIRGPQIRLQPRKKIRRPSANTRFDKGGNKVQV